VADWGRSGPGARVDSLDVRVLLTNDDGIEAEGLQALRRELLAVPEIELAVIAPDSNRSATARSITIRRPLWVEEIDFGDGTVGYATDGTPVDCVRFSSLGLIEGFQAELIVSGINHGSNLGDDITYSGTVAAALEGVVLGIPGIAVSQQSVAREMDFRRGQGFDFEEAARFTARLVQEMARQGAADHRPGPVPLPEGTLLNLNFPAGRPEAVEVCRLGKRVYRDQLSLVDEESGRRQYRIYNEEPGFHHEEGTDLAAVAEGRVAVTPLHLDLTDEPGMETLRAYDLARLLRPAAEEVTE
jgi:5'-nucleotidase